jgi:hypothetical protein
MVLFNFLFLIDWLGVGDLASMVDSITIADLLCVIHSITVADRLLATGPIAVPDRLVIVDLSSKTVERGDGRAMQEEKKETN